MKRILDFIIPKSSFKVARGHKFPHPHPYYLYCKTKKKYYTKNRPNSILGIYTCRF